MNPTNVIFLVLSGCKILHLFLFVSTNIRFSFDGGESLYVSLHSLVSHYIVFRLLQITLPWFHLGKSLTGTHGMNDYSVIYFYIIGCIPRKGLADELAILKTFIFWTF